MTTKELNVKIYSLCIIYVQFKDFYSYMLGWNYINDESLGIVWARVLDKHKKDLLLTIVIFIHFIHILFH